jgi:hypothetical protein
MATFSKHRRNSVISISSGEDSPRSRRGSVISISSDDGSLRPHKRRCLAPSSAKVTEISAGTIMASTRLPSKATSDYGDSGDDDLIAAAKEVELLRSWVDDGIEMAIRERADYTSTQQTRYYDQLIQSSFINRPLGMVFKHFLLLPLTDNLPSIPGQPLLHSQLN